MENKIYSFIKNPFRNGRVFCFYLLVGLSFSIYAQPSLKITDPKKNFGFVKKGEVVHLNYEIINTGTEPLVLTDYKVECSCTTVVLPKQPIMPNQKETIIVDFDTKSVYDRQDRVVEIISNSKTGNQKIRFKGVVLKT